MPLTPPQRRLRRQRRAAERRRREEREARQRERRQRERQAERERVNKLGLMTPEERQRAIRKSRRRGNETRESRLMQSRRTKNAQAVKSLMDLTPQERLRRIRAIRAEESLTEQQERTRIARIRASGRVATTLRGGGPPHPNPNNPPGDGQGGDNDGSEPGLPPNPEETWENLLEGTQRNAFRLIMLEFKRIGLGEGLAREVYNAVVNGVTNVDMILDLVRNSPQYAERFPGMQLRDPNLPRISEAEYIDIEKQYRWVMETAGLPSGFYDSPQDFAKFIGNDMGPTEFQGRVDQAVRVARNVDPFQRDLLQRFYGIGEGELAAFFLDGKVALPLLQRQVEASGVARYAREAGMLQDRGIPEFRQLVDLGVTEEEARAQYGTIAQVKRKIDRFDHIYGADYDTDDAERDAFLGDPSAALKRGRLVRQENATWTGSSRGATGTGSKSLSY